ncbi:MAG: hypothetical protein P8R42_06710 [Candidatus Binatia bacterium]|nr:hypothetical protein [Candidatus Binatia bacterium]
MATAPRLKSRSKVLFESAGAGVYSGDIDAALAATSDVYHLADGLVGLRGTTLAVYRFFEREFLNIARRYGAEENLYPSMLPVSMLEEVNYFSNFPQHVTLCSHFPDEVPFLGSVAAAASEQQGRLPDQYRQQLAPPDHVLQPAVCLPCYRQHRDRVLPPGSSLAVTMQNHVYRYESTNFRSLSRLWDFDVRDIVFFGSLESLSTFRMELMELSIELCRELGLAAQIELASDPFFTTVVGKDVYQRLTEVKYELGVELPQRGERLAVSSFNLHRDFYTKVYDIRFEGGEVAESACIGFGLHRWTYAFLAQLGLEPAQWPRRVQTSIETGDQN